MNIEGMSPSVEISAEFGSAEELDKSRRETLKYPVLVEPLVNNEGRPENIEDPDHWLFNVTGVPGVT